MSLGPRKSKRLLASGLAVWLVLLVLMACSSPAQTATPELSIPVPTWELDSHTGGTLSSENLRGKSYVVNFTWTNCRDTCPTLSLQMALLRDRLEEEGLLGEKVMLVSMSFDPERDTIKRLNEYAGLFGAREGEWHFLTGSDEELDKIITRGFRVSYRPFTPERGGTSAVEDELAPALEANPGDPSVADFLGGEGVGDFLEIDDSIDFDHQNVFILVDGEGNIRHYYIGVFLDRDEVIEDVNGLS